MRIGLRDEYRRRIGRIDVDPVQRPTRVSVNGTSAGFTPFGIQRSLPDADHQPPVPHEVFLNWDTALDDAGHLRRCVACGCPDLFTEKAFPIVTGFIVVLAFIGALLGAVGLADQPPVLIGMGVVLALDVAILLFSRRRLVCYRCRSTFRQMPIARYHRSWDRSIAYRYPALDQPPRSAGPAPVALAERKPPVPDEIPPAVEDKGYFA